MQKGKFYKYPEPKNERIFKVKEKTPSAVKFECGHWVTDCVFIDMIDIATDLAQWQIPKQLKLDL